MRLRLALGAGLLLVSLIAVSACTVVRTVTVPATGVAPAPVSDSSTSEPSQLPTSTTASAPQTQVGTTLQMHDLSGHAFSVTLLQVIDPAVPTQYSPAPPAGDVYAGVQFKIVDTGSAAIDQDPNSWTTVVDSTGMTYGFVGNQLSDCPPFGTSGIVQLLPGDYEVGCVAVVIPSGATIARIVAGSAGMTPVEWRVG